VVGLKAKEMVMKWTIFLALVLSVAMGSCVQTQQGIVGTGTYQVLDLGVHPGFDTSEPSGMNSLGQVSGFSIRTNDSSRRAFFYDTPHCQRIDVGAAVPQQASSEAIAINDSAMVVGSFRRADDGRLRAFSFHQGMFRDLGGGDGVDHHALAVNKSGKIVGFESVPTLPTENAVAYTNGQSVPFPIVGTAYVNRATGISDSGEVTGPLKAGGQELGMKYFPNLTRWYQIRPAASHPQLPDFDRVMQPRAINASGNVTGTIGSTVPHAFLSRNHFELTRDLGTLDSAHPEWFSVGYAINASAHVVGVAQTGSGITAFLHNTITMIDLNTKLSDAPGWRLIGALAINDKGLIAAQASLNNGPGRAVLLVPVSRVGPVTPLCQPSVFG
jgi:probable HAF family extracellular repeat protein